MALFIPTYFSPISQYAALYKANEIIFEVEDNYQKQTYRNRCYVYGANGKQLLNIPISHPKTEGKKKTKDILVEKNSNWQQQHYKSLKTAYNSSPFFEFYIDDLLPVFTKDYKYLLDVVMDTFIIINDALELDKAFTLSEEYSIDSPNDYRKLSNSKSSDSYVYSPYTQIFDDKHGFIKNLSVLDLLFMEGPNSISFLEKLSVTLD
jgi:hypothetical protein